MKHSSRELPDIIISGDSWARGEWQYQTKEILHRGIEQYLEESNYSVVNVACPGDSNNESISRLEFYLNQNPVAEFTVLWIQTDPIRDLRPYTELTQQLSQSGGLVNLQEQLLVDSYTRLNTLAFKYNITIHVIGGLCNLAVDKLETFKNLNPLVPSWVHLLIGDMSSKLVNPYVMGETECSVQHIDLNSYPKTFAYQIVSELYNVNRNSFIFKEKIFHPDGLHPNRTGHKILYNYIVEKLKL